MNLCNVDFFDKNFNNIYHDWIDSSSVQIDDDYLSAGESSITIRKSAIVQRSNYILFRCDGFDYFGIVQKPSYDEYITTVPFKPFLYIFDQQVLFDTDNQGSVALETVIANAIKTKWINNEDTQHNIPGLSVKTTSSTTNWNLDLESSSEDTHYMFVKLYSDLIVGAIQNYGIAIQISLNLATKKIELNIGKVTETTTIDCDLDNVIVSKFEPADLADSTNKLEIWNSKNYTDKIVYYLHTDRTHSTTNTKRILPVKEELKTAAPETSTSGSTTTTTKTFAQAAAEVAEDTFSGIDYKDSIELQVSADDPIVKPMEIKMGEIVSLRCTKPIMKNGIEVDETKLYSTILTGRKVGTMITLLFGTVRSEYTKRLRLGGV